MMNLKGTVEVTIAGPFVFFHFALFLGTQLSLQNMELVISFWVLYIQCLEFILIQTNKKWGCSVALPSIQNIQNKKVHDYALLKRANEFIWYFLTSAFFTEEYWPRSWICWFGSPHMVTAFRLNLRLLT